MQDMVLNMFDHDDLDIPSGAREPMSSYAGTDTSKFQETIDIINRVVDSGQHNYEHCKININTTWNIALLESLLTNYHDREIVDMLKYGFPIEHSDTATLEMGDRNHLGATNYAEHIDKYVKKEVKLGGTIGPFDAIPFKCKVGISPLSSRSKKGTAERRVILDCSWPLGRSLNDGMSKDSYLGECIDLKYPTVDMLARKVHELHMADGSRPIYFFKEDLDRAFRQLRACPKSVPLMGYRWRQCYYFDLVMIMGCRIAPYICQRTSTMITYIMGEMGHFVLNYVDDFLGADYQEKSVKAHSAFIRLLRDIGLSRSERKSVAPTQVIEFIGNLFDAVNMLIGITPSRKVELVQELAKWKFKQYTTRRQLESLVGKLQFVSNCVRPGRLFVSRLLDELKMMNRTQWYRLSNQARKDIRWWHEFIPTFEGTGILWLLDAQPTDSDIAVDACLQGAGGFAFNDEFYSVKFPEVFASQELKITHLELWAVIIAVRLWGESLTGRIVKIRTDNEAVSIIVNTGRSYDEYLQRQLRELVWWLAKYQFKIKTEHLSGRLNRLPDLLSRFHEGVDIRNEFWERVEGRDVICRTVDLKWFEFSNQW